jgi:iron(III) transport system permease protein
VTSRPPWRWASVAGATLLAALCVLPVAALVPAALSHPAIAADALSSRRLGLLFSSVRLATLVLVIDTTVAGAAVLWAHAARPRRARIALGVASAAAFVPPVAHAAAWAGVSDGVRRLLDLPVTPLTGIAGAAVAQGSAYLPLAIVLALAGVWAVDPRLLDAARVQRSDGVALARVLLPLAAPAILAGGGVAALLSLGDEAVPAVFGLDTAAMELFASFAADGSAGATLALSWPLALVCALAALACAAPLRAVSVRPAWGRRAWAVPPSYTALTQSALVAGAVLAVSSSAAVFGALLVGAMPPPVAAAAVGAALPDIATTCLVALGAGASAAALGLLAGSPSGPGATASRWTWGLALVAAVVPAPVMGAGLVALYNNSATAPLYDSGWMLVLAALARFAPLAAIAVAVAAARLDRRSMEAALVSARPGRALLRVVMPQLLLPAAAGGLLVAAFAAGELGATLMVIPPGTSTAVVRAFNLLHYGASQEVAAIALAVAVAGVAAAFGSWLVGRKVWAG